MARKVNFPKWQEFLEENCNRSGPIKVIMGISMVSSEKAEGHYQNGSIFQDFCTEIQKMHAAIGPDQTLSLTVVLTGALHRHNIAIQKNISMEEALEEARKKDQEWALGSQRGSHRGLREGHQLIMQEILAENKIPFQIKTLDTWLFEKNEKTKVAQESFVKIQSLYDNDLTFKQKIQTAAKEKVRRDLMPRMSGIYEVLEKNLKIAKGIFEKSDTLQIRTEAESHQSIDPKIVSNISSTLGQIQRAIREILEKEKMLEKENFLAADERKAMQIVREINQTGLSAAAKLDHLKETVPVAENVFKKVEGAFLKSAEDYLLEEVSSVFLFDSLGNQSYEKTKAIQEKSHCFMTYKGAMNPTFKHACDVFGIVLPDLPYALKAHKKVDSVLEGRKGKQKMMVEVDKEAPAMPPLIIPSGETQSDPKPDLSTDDNQATPSGEFIKRFDNLQEPQQHKILLYLIKTILGNQNNINPFIINQVLGNHIKSAIDSALDSVLSERLSMMLPQALGDPQQESSSGSGRSVLERKGSDSYKKPEHSISGGFFEIKGGPFELEGSPPPAQNESAPQSKEQPRSSTCRPSTASSDTSGSFNRIKI